MAEIELREMGFTYPGAAAPTISNLSLTVANGAAHALLGGSGTGKTTLLNLMSGLLQPSAGVLLFDGVDVSQVRGRDRQVAQVFQFPVFYDGLNVLENLCFPLTSHGSSKRDAKIRAQEIAQRLDIAHLLAEPAARLPLFEKQLLAIGRALVRPNLALVLLDEPLTAVEPKVKWRLRALLREIQNDTQVTMLYVTHDQTEALTFADTVSVMHEGQLLQTGSPNELHDSPEHEYVGYFIGSPGMNLLPATVANGRLRCVGVDLDTCDAVSGNDYRIGFRADWCQLGAERKVSGASTVSLPAEHISQRLTGMVQGRAYANHQLRVGVDAVTVQAPANDNASHALTLTLDRYVLFRKGNRIPHGRG